jgi:hypothetical protein
MRVTLGFLFWIEVLGGVVLPFEGLWEDLGLVFFVAAIRIRLGLISKERGQAALPNWL